MRVQITTHDDNDRVIWTVEVKGDDYGPEEWFDSGTGANENEAINRAHSAVLNYHREKLNGRIK